MMSFCKKSVHSLFGNFSNSKDYGILVDSSTTTTTPTHRHGRGGLTLIAVPGDNLRPINVVESAAVKSPPPTPSSPTESAKRDPGGIGFLDDVGCNVNGLMSCTESLGFESSDERRVDDRMIENFPPPLSLKSKRTISGTRREVKKFPPPLSSLNHNGQPTFFLRPVRRDGRLELTEVKLHWPEILRASRQDGRLRLHFIHDEDDDDEEEEDIEEEVIEEEKKEEFVGKIEEEKEEKIIDEGWQFPWTSGGGSDGFRRCYELSHHSDGGRHHHHLHHNLHVWSQHCVTIR